MKKPIARPILENLLLGLLLLATNIRGLAITWIFPRIPIAALESGIEVVLLAFAMWMLWRAGLLGAYRSLWLRSWPWLCFAALAIASLIWTVDRPATLLRVLILACCSLLAGYLAVRYTMGDLVAISARYCVALVVLCLLIALIWPAAGIMNVPPYVGSWRGLFWHRNYLGSTMALAAIVLVVAFCLSVLRDRNWGLIYLISYGVACALVVLSHSATGLILLLLLHGIVAVLFLWVRLNRRLRPWHYWIIGIASAGALALGLLNLDFILGLFNRNTTFTGRVSLWGFLFQHVMEERPLLGHGFGTLWVQPAFQAALRDALGWPYPVFIGDNGYVDIALQLGLVGLIAFGILILWSVAGGVGMLLQQRTLLSAVPALLMTYMLITNITLSYFLETESFTWLIVFSFVFSAVGGAVAADVRAKISTSSDA